MVTPDLNISHGALKRRQRCCMALLWLFDSAFAIAFVAPLVVGYWRGTWQLMDHLLLPDWRQASVFTSLAIGLGSGIIFGVLQRPLSRMIDSAHHPYLHACVSRLYTAVFCVGCVNHWRGVWAVWDFYTGVSWQSGASSAGIGLLTLAFTRGLRNVLAPPFVVVPDHPTAYFDVPTLFGTKKDRYCQLLLDSIFSTVITGSLVVFVWRGSWLVLDAILFYDRPVQSAWGSLILGGSISFLAFLAQLILIPCVRHMKKGIGKIVIEDTYHTVCFMGAINIWRGVWNILNIYLLPHKPIASNGLTSIGGLLILMCFYCANSILVRGALMDGVMAGVRGVAFSTHYLRFFYRLQLAREAENKRDSWSRGGTPSLIHISAPYGFSSMTSKINGACDGRSYGDGHSLDGYVGHFGDQRDIITIGGTPKKQKEHRQMSKFFKSESNETDINL